jgi:hypothetical protein
MPPAARKTEQNDELPLVPIEPKPESPEDLIFKVRIYPVIFQGAYSWRWELLHHTHKPHVGDFTPIKDPDSYGSPELAEEAARRQVNNIRHVAGLKLNQPSERIIEL